MTATPDAFPSRSDDLQAALRMALRIARKWRQGLATLAGALVVGVLVALLWPRQYRSEAVVHYREGMQWSPTEVQGSRRMGQRFRDSLLARALLSKVIEDMNLFPRMVQAGRLPEAVEEMRAAIGFRMDQGDVYVLSYLGDSPVEAQAVTARLTELLIAENARLRAEQAQASGAFLDAEKGRLEATLTSKETALLKFLAAHPEFAPEPGGAGGGRRGRTAQEADPAPSERESEALVALRREEDRLRRQLASPGQGNLQQDPALVAARDDAEAKLREAERELSAKRAAYTEQHPDVRAAMALVQVASEVHRRAVQALEAAEPRLRNNRLEQIQMEIASLRRLQAQVRPPRPRQANDPTTTKRMVDDEAEWTQLSREASEARERFQQLEARQFVASMTASMATSGQTSQIVVIDPAYLPARSIGLTTTMRFGLAFLLSVLAGLVGAIVAALRDDLVHDRGDAGRLPKAPAIMEIEAADMPRLGATGPDGEDAPRGGQGALGAARALPAEASQAWAAGGIRPAVVQIHRPGPGSVTDPCLVMLSAPESPAAAAFRVLRHRLRDSVDPGTLMVTSASQAEGKSFCAANLALALGEAGRAKVLLVETNFRAPSVARLFGVKPPVCASEQLEAHLAHAEKPWDVVESAAPSVHLLALKAAAQRQPTLDRSLSVLIDSFRMAGYGYIVFDGPSVLGSADVNLVQECLDGLLLVVRAGVSRTGTVQAAVGQVGMGKLAGIALLGA